MPVILSPGTAFATSNPGPPVVGGDETQTITIGGTPTGGTFRLAFQGQTTAPIPWSSTNATLLASIDAALEALSGFGAGSITTAAGTLTAGIGTILITFTGTMGRLTLTAMTVQNNLTGTTPTVAVAQTTPGVTATGRGAPRGKILNDTVNGIAYQNQGTPTAPVWGKIGLQS